jgi:hypothetical protein
MGKILIVVSNTAQVEMFRVLVSELRDIEIIFINTGIPFKNEINKLLKMYGFNYHTMKRCSLNAAKEVLNKENPDIVITGHDQIFMDILFIEASNQKNIQSITIQDGILALSIKKDNSIKKKLFYIIKSPIRFINLFLKEKVSLMYLIDLIKFQIKYSNKYSFIYGHGESTKIAIFGESVYKKLVNEGIPPNKLEITGNPKFDKLIEYKKEKTKNILKEKYNSPKDKAVILLITQQFVEYRIWTKNQRESFVSEIVRAVSNLNNIEFIIKIRHPNEKKDDYIQILDKFDIKYKIFKEEPIEEILSISDVVLSSSSTAILEAIILGKPTMVINLFNEDAPKIYKNSGAIYVESKAGLLNYLNALINNDTIINEEKVNNFIAQQAYKVDGNSSHRILEIIRTYLNE